MKNTDYTEKEYLLLFNKLKALYPRMTRFSINDGVITIYKKKTRAKLGPIIIGTINLSSLCSINKIEDLD